MQDLSSEELNEITGGWVGLVIRGVLVGGAAVAGTAAGKALVEAVVEAFE